MSTIKISALPAASGISATGDVIPISQSGVTNKITRNTLLGITGSPVGTTDVQALTNKTLTSPTISGPTFSGTLIGTYTIGGTPTFPSSVVTLTGSQTLTNKNLTGPTITSPSITGTVAGSAIYSTPTLTVPVIADFTSATHNHSSNATGGTLTVIGGGSSTALVDQSGLTLNIEGRAATTFANFVESGCVWSILSGLNGTMTSGFVWINGRRISVSSVTTKAFTASKDVYVDVDVNGAITYTDNTTNAASPALAASSIRLAIVVTGVSISSINQGDPAATAPVASSVAYSVTDSLGNLIYNTASSPSLIGYRQTVTTNTGVTTEVDLTGLTAVPAIVPAGRKVRVTLNIAAGASNADSYAALAIKEGSTYLQVRKGAAPGPGFQQAVTEWIGLPTTGLHTYKGSIQRAAGTGTLATDVQATAANTEGPGFIKVELV